SAGSVQSVAVRLIVEREREIKAFVPEEYWELHADLADNAAINLRMEVTSQSGKAFKPVNKVQTESAVKLLEKARFQVIDRE
ncbi:DNA topoisomerase I subunit omega, partial [Bacillus subtilis]